MNNEDWWLASRYRPNVGHHRRHSPSQIRNLELSPGQSLLDLGCGVGDYTRLIAERFGDANVVGLDSSPDMIAMARKFELANLRFEIGRAQDLEDRNAFDFIVSTACFHWVPEQDHPGLLTALHRALKARGQVIVEFGAAGNVAQTIQIIQAYATDPRNADVVVSSESPWYFPTSGQYEGLLTESPFSEFQVTVIPQVRKFTEAEFEGWLRSQVLLPWTHQIPHSVRDQFELDIVKLAVEASRLTPGTCAETFVRILVWARK